MSEVTRDEFDKLSRQVDENTRRLAQGDTVMAVINTKLEQIEDKLDELAVDVRSLNEKPAKRWESISGAILQWVVTALLAYIAVKIGLA